MAITSRQNPLVARYRAAARGEMPDVVLLDGVHLIADALRAGVAVEHAAITPAARDKPDTRDLIAALTRAGTEPATVSASVMDALSPVRTSTGIVALAARPAHPPARVYASATTPLVIVAVDVQDPGNVGAVARVAEAAGASGMVAAGASADPFGWKALRGSMGSSLRLPVIRSESDTAVAEARAHGCRIIATSPREGTSVYKIDLTGPLAVWIGGEGRGLTPSIVEEADARVMIPMQAPVESLNVAVAAAIILYEARRQRSL